MAALVIFFKMIYMCLCGISFTDFVSYKKHISNHFKLNDKVLCSVCGKRLLNLIQTTKHYRLKHSNIHTQERCVSNNSVEAKTTIAESEDIADVEMTDNNVVVLRFSSK